ncbi:MAG TPA: hypothetical protein DIT58_12825, partial [Porticoccaceae bacterium]|nr:hypothetical protein [Porticoccaceae bacterium]
AFIAAEDKRFYEHDGADDAAIEEAARMAGAHDFIMAFSEGYATQVGPRGSNLSGGQRQAVGLARMFLADPAIVLLDEPTASMDQASENLVKASLQDFCEDKTLVLITHKMQMLDIVERLVVVDEGRVVADGPKAEVIKALKTGKVRGVEN